MSRILALAPPGFGKTTGIGATPELGIIGLPVEETYVISVTSKPLTFRGSARKYVVTTIDKLRGGRRIITNDPTEIADTLATLYDTPIKYVVWDDANYVMQDWYMANAHRTGWDAPKMIGMQMGKIFKSIELYKNPDKHVIVLAHGEEVKGADGRIYMKFKTTGKMVDEYLTPEGKFDVVLIGKSKYDNSQKKVIKEYITREDEYYSSPKSPYGMFEDLYILNDLGLVAKAVSKYYTEEQASLPIEEVSK